MKKANLKNRRKKENDNNDNNNVKKIKIKARKNIYWKRKKFEMSWYI